MINARPRDASFESYIAEHAPYAISDLSLFFKGYRGHKCSSEEFEQIIKSTVVASANIQKGMNYAYDFIDFVVRDVFSEKKDNYGNLVPLVLNPPPKN
ncbi:VPA1269 family protein [Klebsiella pneumoniae]|uniref:VPA1269 family protein n=1 Tax=Klebsiella pneumoniae TaxID=573 RepID=UPI001E5E58D3